MEIEDIVNVKEQDKIWKTIVKKKNNNGTVIVEGIKFTTINPDDFEFISIPNTVFGEYWEKKKDINIEEKILADEEQQQFLESLLMHLNERDWHALAILRKVKYPYTIQDKRNLLESIRVKPLWYQEE